MVYPLMSDKALLLAQVKGRSIEIAHDAGIPEGLSLLGALGLRNHKTINNNCEHDRSHNQMDHNCIQILENSENCQINISVIKRFIELKEIPNETIDGTKG